MSASQIVKANRQEIIETILDDLDRLGQLVRSDQYIHISRASDAIRELAAELNITASDA